MTRRLNLPTTLTALGLAVIALLAAPAVFADHEKENDGGTTGGIEDLVPFTVCRGGQAGDFPCRRIDLFAAVPGRVFGSGSGSDLWGWVDPGSGREIVIYTLERATVFVDVSDPRAPVLLGRLGAPFRAVARDVKVYRNHAFIVGDTAGHGLQVFDLRRLRGLRGRDVPLAADVHFRGFGSSHNLAIDEASGFAYAVRTDACRDGLYVIDIRGPKNPQFAGCALSSGPIHDTQCVTYDGPDRAHVGRRICFNSNQDRFTILDVTDPAAPRLLSSATYDGLGFVHQGWLTEDSAYFVINDEFDERENGHDTRTYVFDVRDLEAPVHTGVHVGATPATDHNLYIRGDHVFEANYRAGLRILRIDDLAAARLTEVAFFDVMPDSDAAGFAGAWTAYPFFPSGHVAVSTLDGGLFLLRARIDRQEGDEGNDDEGDEHGDDDEGDGHGDDGDCAQAVGEPAYCRECGPCAAREGGCSHDGQCAGNLICAPGFGPSFGFGPNLGVCVRPRGVELAYAGSELSSTTNGVADEVVPRAVNRHGQVTGELRRAGSLRTSAFRWTPGEPFELLDDPPAVATSGWAINDRGAVFGVTLAEVGGVLEQAGVWLHRPGEGFDRLLTGAPPAVPRSFELSDLNDAGQLVGTVLMDTVPGAGGRRAPYLHAPGDGWRSLSGLAPSLRGRSVVPTAINENGQILLVTPPRGGFVLLDVDRLSDLSRLGTGAVVPWALDDRGRVAGSLTTGGNPRAFLFVPGRDRLVDLHRVDPQGGDLSGSVAIALTRQGVAGGLLLGSGGPEALFSWDERRRPQFRNVARRATFANLLPEGATFRDLDLVGMSERQEFLGVARGDLAGEAIEVGFVFSPATGAADLQDLLTASGLGGTVRTVVAISERGDLVVTTEDAVGQVKAVILRPQGQ